ncbi:MAG: hypothetical protein OEU92_28860 [Alphaproteobacteria bacterium]|nr:hypothetical protein [Alphaproteobacteria bacterium]
MTDAPTNGRLMNERASSQPKLTARTSADKAARSDRLAAEMRKNLMKRKQQQRQKAEGPKSEPADHGEPEDFR